MTTVDVAQRWWRRGWPVAKRVAWPPELREAPLRLVPPALLLFSLVLLRVRLAEELDYGVGQALRFGFVSGLVRDLLALGVAALFGIVLFGMTGLPRRFGWALGALVVWGASVANVVYFRFFGMPLDWWIVRLHWADIGVVGGSAVDLGASGLIFVSAAVLIAAIAVAVALPLLARRFGQGDLPAVSGWGPRLKVALRLAVSAYLLATLGWRVPIWLGFHGGTRPLNDSIVRIWLEQNFRSGLYSGVGGDWESMLAKNPKAPSPPAVLARYRDFDAGAPEARLAPLPPASAMPEGTPRWPLVRSLHLDPARTRELRQSLGLLPDAQPNVVVLFLESVRAYELEHPEIGPLLFPRLRAILREHAVQFRQTYSSSIIAGETVRGQFSALCSMLPNALGAATYIAHTTVRVDCIQGFTGAEGYRTAWMNSFRKNFHGKQAFESLHGMQEFYDEDYFRAQGVTERIGQWGLADGPFLGASLSLLEKLRAEGQPVFANLLTISTHHPYSVIPQGPIPEALKSEADEEEYQGYLSRLHYADGAVSDFLEALFASPLAQDTLVVLLGDHSARVDPRGLTDVQREEVRFRIPLAFLTANMPSPRVVDYPVHQIDVAPSIAAVVGGAGEVTWIGRSVWDGSGSPWVYESEQGLAYRLRGRGCYTLASASGMRCVDTSAGDPLYVADLPQVQEDAPTTAFFHQMMPAVMRSIVFNEIAPTRLEPGASSHAAVR